MENLGLKLKENKKWIVGAIGVFAITLAIAVFGPNEERAAALTHEYIDVPQIQLTRGQLINQHPAHQG